MTEFPKRIALVDTGERRYPKVGEWYYWRSTGEGQPGPLPGEVMGPCLKEEEEQPEGEGWNWAIPAESCAIYRWEEPEFSDEAPR